MINKIFDEVSQWINYIDIWEDEYQTHVPDRVLDQLEHSLEKAIYNYKQNRLFEIKHMYTNTLLQ